VAGAVVPRQPSAYRGNGKDLNCPVFNLDRSLSRGYTRDNEEKILLRSQYNILYFFVVFLFGCASFSTPKNYIPDDKVVFLREKLEFGPIKYDPLTVDPYNFAPDAGALQIEKPAFLQIPGLENILKADFAADSRLYREIKGHLLYVASLQAFKDMGARLDTEVIRAVPPLPPDHGDKVKDYSNGAQYAYPGSPDALITILNSGEYFIDFSDKSAFKYFPDGSYTRLDASGKEVSSLNKQDSSIVMRDNDATFTVKGDFKRMSLPQCIVEYSANPEPQYHFSFPDDQEKKIYTFFVNPAKEFFEYSVSSSSGIRFDYLLENDTVLITSGSRAIVIDSRFEKQLSTYDTKLNKATNVHSIYLPEGIAMESLAGPDLSYADINPAWPEKYLFKSRGPFTVLYTAKDEGLLSKLDPKRLTLIDESDRRLSGFGVTRGRTILIPPDLASYCKLQARKPGSTLNWYPSGFETNDHIVMWPISVPRYNSPEGQDYFFNQEFYEILAHEYLHLMIGENAGLLSPVPVWLNEGFAVYIESQFSSECRAYWDATFEVSRDHGRLLDWDQVTIHGTGDFEVTKARIEYAQSYALVSALIERFGPVKVAEYVKSFRVSPEESMKVDLINEYRVKFQKIFGITFQQALDLLKRPS
jgi:hypothetical protein